MDISSVFKSEIFRPIVITLIPSLIGLIPFVFVLYIYFPDSKDWVSKNSGTFLIIVVLLCIAIGQVLEDLGSAIENIVWKRVRKSGNDDVQWNDFLRIHFEKEPIGMRYMRTIVLRMKFENSTVAALVLFSAGILWLWLLGFIESKVYFIGILAVTFILMLYMLYESYLSSALLKDLRANLMKGVIIL